MSLNHSGIIGEPIRIVDIGSLFVSSHDQIILKHLRSLRQVKRVALQGTENIPLPGTFHGVRGANCYYGCPFGNRHLDGAVYIGRHYEWPRPIVDCYILYRKGQGLKALQHRLATGLAADNYLGYL